MKILSIYRAHPDNLKILLNITISIGCNPKMVMVFLIHRYAVI